MSLEDAIRRKLQEQKKDEQNEQDRLKQTAIQALRNQKAGKHVVQQTEPQKSGSTGMDFLQAGALKNIDLGKEFQDGYQFGDYAKTELALKKAVAQTILGTGLDNTLNMWKGIGGTVEGVVDLGMYGVAGIQKATGHEKAAEKTRKAAQADFFGETVLGDALEFVNKSSVLGNTSKSIAAGIGQGALTVGLGMLTGGLGAAASTAITTGVTGLSSMGQGMTEAYEGNATDKEAALYGLISGVVDAGTELLSGGLGKGANAIGIGKGIGGIDDMIASGLTKNIKNKFAKNLAQMGVKAVGEGVEEALSYAGQTLAKKWTYLSEKELKELWSNQELLENFVVGTLTSAFMQAGDAADATAKGQDFVTGRTDAEQTVIDKVYKDRVAEQEKGGKKLTTKEKGQILDAVEQAYERGEIAVEDIEAALGGETYRKYTEATKQQEAMQAEFDQLNGMKKSDMTGAQEDRLQELRQQLETMKTEDTAGKLQLQYQQEARAKAGGGQLMESYNQREQRRQAFQADVESYDAKQRAIVQKAIDSGILNNTRKSHEFVDLVAKIGAETGTDFDFTDSKKLRESGFALEGVTVNGFTDGKTVTVNINSAKALNTVVGHEIMHVLEGTELAGKLQEQLFAYAKTKGEFDKRRADLETLYAGRDADIDRELAADLVGDYLFTDIDFVRNLKAGDRNLFQRVFDEIKHLVKLATAGSKEARELEKVKKLFEDVYREAGTEKSTAKDGGVEYSISKDVNGNSFVDVTEDIFDANNGESIARVIQKVIAEKFHNIIDVHGQKIQINKTTNDEFRRSNSANELMSSNPQAYNDKLKTIANADEILRTARNWIGEEKKHNRKDDIVEFARGNVAYRVGLNGYIADVIVGTRKNGSAVLYDLVNIYEKEITEAPVTVASKDNSQRRQDASAEEIITQPNATVKQQLSLSPEADRAYMAAVERGDMETVKKLVYEAAKQAGYTEEKFHGTHAKFNSFDMSMSRFGNSGFGFYFGDEGTAAEYGGDNQLRVFLNTNRIATSDDHKITARQFMTAISRLGLDASKTYKHYVDSATEYVRKRNDWNIAYDLQRWATNPQWYGKTKSKKLNAGEILSILQETLGIDGIANNRETVIWDNKLIKLADPVTYDDSGNVIPLSERFNPKSNDMRYSLSPEADRAYMDAVENANIEAAQVMVDEAANEAGFTVSGHHGTYAMFNEFSPDFLGRHGLAFGPGFYFSTRRATAKSYEEKGGRIIDAYLKAEKSLSPDEKTMSFGQMRKFAKALEKASKKQKLGLWGTIELYTGEHNDLDIINELWYKARDNMRHEEFFGILRDTLGYDSVKVDFEGANETFYVVFNADQIKSADPVTYDDEGNVIPLSQRFNPKSKDIRESLSRAGETAGFDDSQIYGRDVALEAPVQKAPVAAQPESKATGMEAPTAAEMPKAQAVEAPVAEEKPVQTAQEKAKAAPVMEAPTAAEMPGEKPVEAPVAEEAKEGAVETKAPKEGMEPVVSPKVYKPGDGKLKPKAEDMSQEEREYRDSMEDKPAETFRDVMEKRLQSLRREIEENRRNKQTVAEQYDEKIQSLKDEFVALKNKNTKHAQDILRSISRNQQLKEARMAEYDKRINDLTKRVQRTQERIDSDTGRADWAQGKLDKIDAKYEEDLEALETRQKEQRRELEAKTASKEQYFADRALELYDELSTLKKGVKASEDLAYFLDRGHTWNAIKSALLLVKDKPSGIANPHFGLEKIVRERLEQRYNDALAELADLDTQQAMDRKALEDAMKKEKATLQASQIKKTKMEQYQAESAELAGNTATWKDKKTGFGYSMQTMHRYLREVVRDENGNPDIARADAIYAYLQGTYNQNEAALKREAKKRKDQIRKLGLNKYEDEYGAMLGELKYNPESQNDAELAYRAEEFLEAHKDKIDLEKTNKAIEMLRSEYDELIELLNNALREQGFREIPYRKGYFPHFMEPSQNFVQKLLNWKPKNNEIPTSIAGMTEEFNPQRSWQGFDKERKGNATVYSLQKGYNQYLDGALDWIYHIADIQRRRAFENHIREVHTDENAKKRIDEIRDSDQYDAEEAQAQIESVLAEKKNPLNNLVVELRRGTNTLAGKKSSMDRSVEADFGRWVYSTMTNVANRSSANMVAGNLASAATNVIPIVQSWTQVKPRNSFKAVKQMIQAMNNDDGLVEKSAFLTNRLLQNESLYKDTWDKIGDVVSLPMEAVDKFTSQVVWRSKYIENIEKGMSEEAAIRDADQFAENVIAGRSRGNMPTIFDSKNPIYKVLTAFQLEVANQYGYFFKDVPTDTKAAMKGMTEKQKTEEKTKLAIGLTNMLLGTYVYNAAMESITGNTPATDPIRILEGIIRDIWGEAEDDDEEETGEEIAHVAASALEELAKELPYIGGLLGGGRISSAAAIPYGDPFNMIKGTMEDFGEGDWANLKKEWLNLVYYGILPMGGGQIKKINEGIGMYLDTSEEFPFLPKIAETPGSYTTSGNLRYAVEPTFWNVMQSILFGQYANANAREYFDEGRSPLSPNQVEEFSSVDMSMSEYWDYRDALKAAGDKTADQMEVVMGLDLPVEQKNILANNILDRKDPIDMTGAEDFGSFAEFDFYSQNPEKYKFLNDHGISWKEYTELETDKKEAVDNLFKAPKKTEFLLKKGITAAQWKDMDEEAREELNFEYNNPEKYSFLQKNGISVADYSGFDKATKDAWDTMAKNPKKYDFLKKQGVTVDQYKLFNQGWKDAWNWAYNNQDAYLVSQGVTEDLYTYRRYVDKINGISGDKRKSDVWKYIQGLDLSDGAKLLLFKQEYPKDDTYDTEIVRYVQSLGMTYAEKKRILEKLGFKIDANGKITK